jgi:hypothetical protein
MASEPNQPGMIDPHQQAGPAEEPRVSVPEPPVEELPAVPVTNTVACKFCCRTTEVCRSRLRNVFEWSIALVFVPYRCLYCGYRGFALRFQVPRSPANREILHDTGAGSGHKRKPPANAA